MKIAKIQAKDKKNGKKKDFSTNKNGKKMETLQAQDIANAILYAVDSPSHVNVNEVLIRPTTQEK